MEKSLNQIYFSTSIHEAFPYPFSSTNVICLFNIPPQINHLEEVNNLKIICLKHSDPAYLCGSTSSFPAGSSYTSYPHFLFAGSSVSCFRAEHDLFSMSSTLILFPLAWLTLFLQHWPTYYF